MPVHLSNTFNKRTAIARDFHELGELSLLAADDNFLYHARRDGTIEVVKPQADFKVVDTLRGLVGRRINHITCSRIRGCGNVLIAVGGRVGVAHSGVAMIVLLDSGVSAVLDIGESAWSVDVHHDSGLIVIGTNGFTFVVLRLAIDDDTDENNNEIWRGTMLGLDDRMNSVRINIRSLTDNARLIRYGGPLRTAHQHNIPGLAISPDCEYVATVSIDHSLVITRLGDLEHISHQQCPAGWLWGVAWLLSREVKAVQADDPLVQRATLIARGKVDAEMVFDCMYSDEVDQSADNGTVKEGRLVQKGFSVATEVSPTNEDILPLHQTTYRFPLYSDDPFPAIVPENMEPFDKYTSSLEAQFSQVLTDVTRFPRNTRMSTNGHKSFRIHEGTIKGNQKEKMPEPGLNEDNLLLVTGPMSIFLYSYDIETTKLKVEDVVTPLSCRPHLNNLANRFGFVEWLPELSLAVCGFQRHGHIFLVRIVRIEGETRHRMVVEHSLRSPRGTPRECSGDKPLENSTDYITGLCVRRRYHDNHSEASRGVLAYDIFVSRLNGSCQSYEVQARSEGKRLDITACLL